MIPMAFHSRHHAPGTHSSWKPTSLTDNLLSNFWSKSWERRWVSRVSTTNCPRALTFSASRATAMACRRGRSRDSSSRSWRPMSPEENLPSSPSWEQLSRSGPPALIVHCRIKITPNKGSLYRLKCLTLPWFRSFVRGFLSLPMLDQSYLL